MAPGDPAAHNGRIGKVLTVSGHSVRMEWADGSTGYVRREALTPVAPEATCTVEQALEFVARAEAQCSAHGGTKVATPLRVLLALASAAKGRAA